MPQPRRLSPADLLEIRDGVAVNKDARMTNCLLETSSGKLEILKRPGYAVMTTVGAGQGYGAIDYKDANGNERVMQIQGNNYYIVAGVPWNGWTTLGSQTGNFGTSSFAFRLYLQYGTVLYGIADATGNNNNSYFSQDGKSWSVNSAMTVANILQDRMVGCVSQGKMWICDGQQTNGGVQYSTGGAWTRVNVTTGTTGYPLAMYSVSTTLYLLENAGGTGTVSWWKSTNGGVTWTIQGGAGFIHNHGGGAAFLTLNGTFYLIGGVTSAGAYSNEVWSSTDGETWALVGTAPWSVRAYIGSTTQNGFAFIAGGETTAAVAVKDIWMTSDFSSWLRVATDTSPANILNGVLSGNASITAKYNQPYNSSFMAYANRLYRFGVFASSATCDTATFIWFTAAGGAGVIGGGTAPSSLVINQSAATAPPSGTFFTSANPIDFSQNYLRTIISIKNANYAWIYTIATNTLTQVTDSDYPATTVRGIAYLNGVFYVMDPNGTIYGSGTNDFTTWTATNVVAAQSEPDGAVCLTKYGQYVVALGNYTTEFFFNDPQNASPASPLSPVQNGQFLVGCGNGDTVAQNQASVFWAGQSKVQGQAVSSGFSIVQMSGMSYKTISTPSVERLMNYDGLVGAWGMMLNLYAHDCYVINMPNTGVSLAWDLEMQFWYFLTRQNTAVTVSVDGITCAAQYPGATLGTATVAASDHGFNDGDPVTIAGADQSAYNGYFNITYVDGDTFTYPTATIPVTATGTITAAGYTAGYFPIMMAFQFLNTQVFQDRITGQLCQFDDALFTDAGNYIDYRIRTANIERGEGEGPTNEPKFMPWIDLITDRAASSMLVHYTDDDYQTYSKYQKVSLANERSRITRLGSFYRRALELRHTDNVACRFQGIDLPIEQGSE